MLIYLYFVSLPILMIILNLYEILNYYHLLMLLSYLLLFYIFDRFFDLMELENQRYRFLFFCYDIFNRLFFDISCNDIIGLGGVGICFSRFSISFWFMLGLSGGVGRMSLHVSLGWLVFLWGFKDIIMRR